MGGSATSRVKAPAAQLAVKARAAGAAAGSHERREGESAIRSLPAGSLRGHGTRAPVSRLPASVSQATIYVLCRGLAVSGAPNTR